MGRPVAKAWNAILAHPFATKAKPAGHPDRIAIPVAVDLGIDREITLRLVVKLDLMPLIPVAWPTPGGSNRQRLLIAQTLL